MQKLEGFIYQKLLFRTCPMLELMAACLVTKLSGGLVLVLPPTGSLTAGKSLTALGFGFTISIGQTSRWKRTSSCLWWLQCTKLKGKSVTISLPLVCPIDNNPSPISCGNFSLLVLAVILETPGPIILSRWINAFILFLPWCGQREFFQTPSKTSTLNH